VTARDKALCLLSDGKVRFVPGTRYHFRVVGSDPFADPYTVVIDGHDRCDCAAHGVCSHIIAARIALDVFLGRRK
jgi:hypothetical protein